MACLGIAAGCAGMASAANLTWDADLGIPDAQDGNGTWTSSTPNFWDGTANATPINGTDQLIIGAAAGEFVITIDNGGAYLDYADATSNSSLTFNQNYTLAGATAGDGLSVGNVVVAAGKTVTISAGLNDGTSAGQKTWSVNSGSTLNLSGGGDFQNLGGPASGVAGTINITGGTWTNPGSQFGANGSILNINQSSGTYNFAAGFQTGTSLNAATAAITYTMTGGAMNLATGGFTVGSGSGSATGIGTGTFNLDGGSITLLQNNAKAVVGGGGNGTTGGANGVLNIISGTFTTTATANSKFFLGTNESTLGATSSAVNISGGVVKINGIQFGDNGTARTFTAGSTATLNLTGGTLNIGFDGIGINGTQANLARSVNLGGGTVGAYGANWTSQAAVDITLTGTNGNVTFRASDVDEITARNITIAGVVSGPGGFNKTGAGMLTLSNAANNLSGINILTGVVSISNNNTIADGANVAIATGGIFDLNYTGTDTVGALFIDGVAQSLGSWGSLTSSADNKSAFFTGSGVLNVTAVPEPATWLLLGAGFGALTLLKGRRRPQA